MVIHVFPLKDSNCLIQVEHVVSLNLYIINQVEVDTLDRSWHTIRRSDQRRANPHNFKSKLSRASSTRAPSNINIFSYCVPTFIQWAYCVPTSAWFIIQCYLQRALNAFYEGGGGGGGEAASVGASMSSIRTSLQDNPQHTDTREPGKDEYD